MLDRVQSFLDTQRDTVINLQRHLTSVPALGPDNGGPGEREKADLVRHLLASLGLPAPREINAPDTRVPCGHRPNLAVILPGVDTSRTFWVISHLDIVPPGDLGLWRSDPYQIVVDGDLIYGRGVEDNQQASVSSLLVAKALAETGSTPPVNYGLLFVSDEETGSKFGLDYVAGHGIYLGHGRVTVLHRAFRSGLVGQDARFHHLGSFFARSHHPDREHFCPGRGVHCRGPARHHPVSPR